MRSEARRTGDPVPDGSQHQHVAFSAWHDQRRTTAGSKSPHPEADHAELRDKGVDVDAELMGGDGVVPMLFFFRDNNKIQLMIVQAQ
jgi:hypothetical protein